MKRKQLIVALTVLTDLDIDDFCELLKGSSIQDAEPYRPHPDFRPETELD